ncbi:MAG: F0F1 ATP synthase subunit C, partial [Steroidobacteraceae bacterium]
MSPQFIAQLYSFTAVGVGIILGLAGLGSALGWG